MKFKIKVREDGGYDCTTSIISMGEILEGLKGRKDFGELKTTEDEKGQIYDNFEVYMISLTQYMAAKTGMAEYEDFTRRVSDCEELVLSYGGASRHKWD